MHDKLFILWVWTLGITLAGTLIYGLVNFPNNTITQYMIDHVEYRVILTSCVVLQTIQWYWCIWSKKGQNSLLTVFAYIFLTAMLISWIALSDILTTDVHIILVYICQTCLLIFILILSHIVQHERAVYVLYLCLVLMIASAIAMICLYTRAEFFIPEHVGFLTYDIVFTSFFTVHTYQYWDHSRVVDNALEMYSSDWEAPSKDSDPLFEDEDLQGSFFMGRCGLVWIPTPSC